MAHEVNRFQLEVHPNIWKTHFMPPLEVKDSSFAVWTNHQEDGDGCSGSHQMREQLTLPQTDGLACSTEVHQSQMGWADRMLAGCWQDAGRTVG
ncbi:MAG: hypothetical protein M1840_003322 [Geoglossum simile]|nr:MAG: hypothetical protein M1840_003322 [Geoglossum simile]